MSFSPKKLLALLLAALMLLSCVSCATGQEEEDNTNNASTNAVTEDETSFKPDIDTANYDCEFNITGVGTIINYAYAEELEGEPFNDSIYERCIKIQDHLGVTLVKVDAGDWLAYSNNVIRTVQAGDDEYQLVSTHPYQGVTSIITSNAAFNYSDLEAINLDAPYWAADLMEEIKIGDQYLMGYNDMCLSDVQLLVFNKDLMERYNLTAPYQDVRNKTWTFDKLVSMASNVAEDNGDQIWDHKDTYGITGWGWTDFISLMSACDLKIVDRNAEGSFVIDYDNHTEKVLDVAEKLYQMYHAEYAYFNSPLDNRTGVTFTDGNSLFQTYGSVSLPNIRDTKIRVGVLPYPMYDEKQTEYRTLSWNGVMFVPASISNPDMVGEVLELLAYYTAPVKIAYYEDLLGSKLAEAPDDAEMLDVIWESLVSDVGVVTANINGSMDGLVYLMPNLAYTGTNTYASYTKSRIRTAQRELDKLFEQ